MKKALVQHLRGRGLAVADVGTDTTESVDYPDIAGTVARTVARGEADAGIVIDGAGIGSGDRGQQDPRHSRGDVSPTRRSRATRASTTAPT